MGTGSGRTYPRNNWLPAVVPEEARRFRVEDETLAQTLVSAGAEVVGSDSDVEVGSPSFIRGEAPCAVVTVDDVPPEGGARPWRLVRRAAGSVHVRRRALQAARDLRARGYGVRVVLWEWEHFLRLPGRRPERPLGLADRLPLSALVVGTRSTAPTILERALESASSAGGVPLSAGWPLATQGGLVVVTEGGVVRVAVGPACDELRRQREAVERLRASGPPPEVAERAPWSLGHGTAGIAEWSLERRLPGSTPQPGLTPALVGECVDFLVALHATNLGEPPADADGHDAEVIASVAGTSEAVELAARWSSVLAELPRGFAHGDFWSKNLLADDGRLVGVVDWDRARAGVLPLLDFLQLHVNAVRARTHQFLGPAIVEHLLPWAAAGGDDVASGYARRIGFEPTPEVLEALVFAFWLDRVAHELRTYGDRVSRPLWLERNVHVPLRALSA